MVKWWLLGGVAFLMMSCGGDDEASSEPEGCSIDRQTGCDEGMECATNAEGAPECFCSSKAQTGCNEGLECQPLEGGGAGCFCSIDQQSGCEQGLACQPIIGGHPECLPPVIVAGQVFDLATGEAIAGARVVARDVNNAAVSGVSVTDAEGRYELSVPTPHDAEGALASHEVLLRADAAGFVSFPKWPRVALPIDVKAAEGDPPTLETSATDIGLLSLRGATDLGAISGIVLADAPRGTLVVAGGSSSGGGVTGIADLDGAYTVFNVPAGSTTVRGYKAGLQLEPEAATVTADEITEGVDLEASGEATATVRGQISMVNPGEGEQTSVILAVEETFDPLTASGEAPPGLRVGGVTGAWAIHDVPRGDYVALAAFEDDFLVRDPDTSIGGTDIARLSVDAADIDVAEGFKITGSLDVVSPDAEEEVSGTPSFIWVDDSSEDHYEVAVFDAYGTLIWERKDVPGVSGDKHVTVEYGGPNLEPNLLYQFRATSIKRNGTPISRTEDLRGVFLYR